MKKHFTIGLGAMLIFMLASALAFAGEKTVSGFTGGHGQPAMACEFKASGDYTCELKVIAVFLKKNPQIKGATLDAKTGDYNLYFADNPEFFKGATLYALGTGENWRGGKALEKIKTENALDAVPITSPSATLKFKNLYPDKPGYYQPIVFMIQLDKAVYKDNGGRAWGGVPDYPNGPWLARSIKNEVQVWVYVNNKTRTVDFPGEEGRRLAAQLE